MSAYLWIKLLHVLGSTVLFGTGMGIAFFMWHAYRGGDRQQLAATTRTVVLADWLFTTPAVIVQAASGLWLVWRLGVAPGSAWFISVIALYVLVGACWLPVVGIQMQIRNRLEAGASLDDVKSLMRAWTTLGVVAFSGVLGLFYLMVSKTGMSNLWIGGAP